MIREAQNAALLRDSQAQSAISNLKALISEALADAGVDIKTSQICMDCGTIRNRRIPVCGNCHPDAAPTKLDREAP